MLSSGVDGTTEDLPEDTVAGAEGARTAVILELSTLSRFRRPFYGTIHPLTVRDGWFVVSPRATM